MKRRIVILIAVCFLASCANKWEMVRVEQTKNGFDSSCLYRAFVNGAGQHAGASVNYESSYFYSVYVSSERLVFANYGDQDAIIYRLALTRGGSAAISIDGDSDYINIGFLEKLCAKAKK